jgi:hypothetical protein
VSEHGRPISQRTAPSGAALFCADLSASGRMDRDPAGDTIAAIERWPIDAAVAVAIRIAERSRKPVGRPRISADLRNLIGAMSRANHLWGAPHLHSELLKLGFTIAQSTVACYMYWGLAAIAGAGGPF